MKKVSAVASAVALFGFAGVASANIYTEVEVFQLGSFELAAAEVAEFDLTLTPNAKGVIGFLLEWDYDETVSDGSWASDAQARLTSPGGSTWVVGGFSQDIAPDALWSFDGSGSDGPGHYGDLDPQFPWKGDIQPKEGLWHLEFENDWNTDGNPNQYNNLTITFYKGVVPAPGALALIGLAGVTARRRRR